MGTLYIPSRRTPKADSKALEFQSHRPDHEEQLGLLALLVQIQQIHM